MSNFKENFHFRFPLLLGVNGSLYFTWIELKKLRREGLDLHRLLARKNNVA